jgi:arginine-tRNA-protein transferase
VGSLLASHYPSHPAPLKVPLMVFPEHACSYLPGRNSRSRGFVVGEMPGGIYQRFMDAGFRRSGKLVYQPVCAGCRACVSLRVRVETFQPSKSQRRCIRRNADLVITSAQPIPTEEKFDLYRRYTTQWHGKPADDPDDDDAGDGGWETFTSFLYDSPVQTLEFCYRDASGRLLAVGICDVCELSLSSVYVNFDPADAKRGLGTFGAVREIAAARGWEIPYYYLGYWIAGCGAMQYKSSFRPCEVLGSDGVWRPHACDAPDSVHGNNMR